MTIHRSFWIIVTSIVIILVVPNLFQDGMFMDGMLYSSVANNLSNDIGTFWHPYFSDSWGSGHGGMDSFHEQPPLVFYLLSLFFRMFGDGMLTERIYVLLMTACSVFMIHKIWTILPHTSESYKKMSWLPVLIWITFPLVFWSHQHMLCENTMEVFILCSVFFSLKAVLFDKRIYLNLLLAGIFVFLASFSKGVPGLFGLATIPIFFVVFIRKSILKYVIYSLIVLAVPVLIYTLFFLSEEAANALSFYYNERLVGRVQSSPTTTDRLQVFKEVTTHILLPLGLILIALIYRRAKKKSKLEFNFKLIILLALIGFSGVLPLSITLIQRGFYASPAMPYFALALGCFAAPLLVKINIQKHSALKRIGQVSIAVLAIVIVASTFMSRGIKRDKSEVEFSYKVKDYLQPWECLGFSDELKSNYVFRCYLMRYAEVTDHKLGEDCGNMLSIHDDKEGFVNEPIKIGEYYLYQK